MIHVGSSKLPLDQSKVLVLIQGTVMIAICPTKLRDGKATPTELRMAEFSNAMTIQMLKPYLGRALRFVEVDGTIGIAINCREGSGPTAATRKR
jgi:hypothetical protein